MPPPRTPAAAGTIITAGQDGPGRKIVFSDDASRLSTAFKCLGLQWKHDKGRVAPKKFRQSLIASTDPIEWSMGRSSQFSDDEVDMVLYALTAILPSTRVQEFGATTKGELRDQAYAQNARIFKRDPQRLALLAENLENLPMICLRLGYPPDMFPPKLYAEWRERNMSAGHSQAVPPSLPAAPLARVQDDLRTEPSASPPPDRLALSNTVTYPDTPLKRDAQGRWPSGSIKAAAQAAPAAPGGSEPRGQPQQERAESPPAKRLKDAAHAVPAAPSSIVQLNVPTLNLGLLRAGKKPASEASTTASRASASGGSVVGGGEAADADADDGDGFNLQSSQRRPSTDID